LQFSLKPMNLSMPINYSYKSNLGPCRKGRSAAAEISGLPFVRYGSDTEQYRSYRLPPNYWKLGNGNGVNAANVMGYAKKLRSVVRESHGSDLGSIHEVIHKLPMQLDKSELRSAVMLYPT
jgi:hypothetical protein